MRKQSSQIKIIEDETESHRSRSDRNSMNSSMISSNSTCSIEETSYDSSNRKQSACFSSESTARGRPIARRKSSNGEMNLHLPMVLNGSNYADRVIYKCIILGS